MEKSKNWVILIVLHYSEILNDGILDEKGGGGVLTN
jgi:hypothetical protein